MDFCAKKQYVQEILTRYKDATKKAKQKILDECCKVCHFNRKYAIRKLNHVLCCQNYRANAGRKRFYKNDILKHIKKLWFSMDQICSKKFVVAIKDWLPYYNEKLTDETRNQILSISPATLDRILKPIRMTMKRTKVGTKPGSLLKNYVPIRDKSMDVTRAGYLEADTVAHCGNSMAGEFIWSITFTDIATAWTEIRAVLGKGSKAIVECIKEVVESVPFEVLGFNVDNGSEFLNHHLLNYFSQQKKIYFTRSRPYQKNDNAHVEQKNWTHVRNLLGYERLEEHETVVVLNEMYIKTWCPYQNFFIPNQKIISKERHGSKIVKRYDKPQTAYARLLRSAQVSDTQKNELMEWKKNLNPFDLKSKLDSHLKVVFDFARATRFKQAA